MTAVAMTPNAGPNYKSPRDGKSNHCRPAPLAPRLAGLLQHQQGQTTVEYMLLVAVVVVALAASISVLPKALAELLNGLAELLGQTYP